MMTKTRFFKLLNTEVINASARISTNGRGDGLIISQYDAPNHFLSAHRTTETRNAAAARYNAWLVEWRVVDAANAEALEMNEWLDAKASLTVAIDAAHIVALKMNEEFDAARAKVEADPRSARRIQNPEWAHMVALLVIDEKRFFELRDKYFCTDAEMCLRMSHRDEAWAMNEEFARVKTRQSLAEIVRGEFAIMNPVRQREAVEDAHDEALAVESAREVKAWQLVRGVRSGSACLIAAVLAIAAAFPAKADTKDVRRYDNRTVVCPAPTRSNTEWLTFDNNHDGYADQSTRVFTKGPCSLHPVDKDLDDERWLTKLTTKVNR